MTALLAAIVAAGIILPHALRLQAVHPVTAIVLWLSSLALRALTGVLAVILLLFFLPGTAAFMALTHWCLDVALPFTADAIHVEGHGLADLALFVPGAALALSLLVACYRTARSARQARHLVEQAVLGHGPHDSLIVSGPEVLFAVAGLLRPRIVVSAGALTCLDDDELEAALDHERAHIVRRHRFVMLLAIAFAAVGRAVPGAALAFRELGFQLERDADRWALRQPNDRLALASVIYKAATAASANSPAFAMLGSSGVRERLDQLLDEHPATQAGPIAAALNALATAMVVCTLLLAVAVPAAAAAGLGEDAHRGHHASHCHH
jgi:Zn-dependent protease with chaperone function